MQLFEKTYYILGYLRALNIIIIIEVYHTLIHFEISSKDDLKSVVEIA